MRRLHKACNLFIRAYFSLTQQSTHDFLYLYLFVFTANKIIHFLIDTYQMKSWKMKNTWQHRIFRAFHLSMVTFYVHLNGSELEFCEVHSSELQCSLLLRVLASCKASTSEFHTFQRSMNSVIYTMFLDAIESLVWNRLKLFSRTILQNVWSNFFQHWISTTDLLLTCWMNVQRDRSKNLNVNELCWWTILVVRHESTSEL